jgi:hypothetical protein
MSISEYRTHRGDSCIKGGPTRCDFQPRSVAGRTPSFSAAWAVFRDLVILVRQNFWGLLAIL